jgi:hypothetical protein
MRDREEIICNAEDDGIYMTISQSDTHCAMINMQRLQLEVLLDIRDLLEGKRNDTDE